MDELKNLALNDIGIAYISKDAFSYLEDSLKHLELRENKLRSFPIAIQVLSHLESLDLFGNEIKTVPDDLTFYLQSSLKRLKKLTLNCMKMDLKFRKIIE
jgi:Leucine-rich repeat (LRR) protein